MSAAATIILIDKLVAGLMAALNLFGASQRVSAIIAARIAEGRETWTDAERAEVQAGLAADKQYAADAIDAAQLAEQKAKTQAQP